MPEHRSYRLLCPIARALDRVGDRWSLLILRDLHAGPARFGDLLTGLTGIASNLLATRLQQLQDDGLIVKRTAEHGVVVYALTEDGEGTAPLLFELAALGAQYPAPGDLRRPGNLRTIVVTLKEALRRAVKDDNVHAELIVDGEHFAIDVEDGDVSVRYGPYADAPLCIATDTKRSSRSETGTSRSLIRGTPCRGSARLQAGDDCFRAAHGAVVRRSMNPRGFSIAGQIRCDCC